MIKVHVQRADMALTMAIIRAMLFHNRRLRHPVAPLTDAARVALEFVWWN